MAELNGKRVVLAIQRLGDAKLQEKTITANGEIRPDTGYDGFSKVIVNVPNSGGGSITEVATEREMEFILANATSFSDGQIFLYTGTTGKYEKDTYYVLQY